MKHNFTRICIAGAGAIGCTLAARLATTGLIPNILARGDTLTALKTQGIELTDLDGYHHATVHASDNPQQLGPQELIFICTKAPALADILETLQPMITTDTIVIPLVNGVPWWYFHGLEHGDEITLTSVDPDQRIERLLPASQVIGAVTFMTAHTQAPAKVQSTNPHLLTVGELNHQSSERLLRVRQLIEDAGIEARASDHIRDPLWTKIIANLTSNPLSIISGASLSQIYSSTQLAPLTRQILNETLLVAAAYSARIPFDPPTFMQMGAEMGEFKTSMLQDYQAGRPLELATIGDAVVELAQRVGLDMPITRHTLGLAHFMDEQNRASSM
ncbi:ketopantoate reductase family protein [Celerinatantimonas yamalensis]|uniref:2-dehydropantoate 2-reductase n=1 Tax=Celerinatantimonas yamalensis TaxID=559956 RepID=A0ABW9G4Q3_9GAMM